MNNDLNIKQSGLSEPTNIERIIAIESFKWINYPRAIEILEKMNHLLIVPTKDRMLSMLLIGDTNNGKTAILKRFVKQNPSFVKKDTGQISCPVLYVQAPPEPDERRFYNSILESVSAPYKFNDRVDKKHIQVKNTLRNLDVKILIIDEIQHVLAGSQMKQRSFLNVIKHLSNESKIPFIGAGIKTAQNALQNDEQLFSRFTPEDLELWKYQEGECDYKRLLQSLEMIVSLKNPSNIVQRPIALKILSMSEGTIGEIVRVVQIASITAIKNKSEKITLELLNKIDYSSPSERMKRFR
jgi:Cdc6-like AAA superfamily ATPase